MARRDEREYREYLSEEQRSQPGCPAREMVLDQRGWATRRRRPRVGAAVVAAPLSHQRSRRWGELLSRQNGVFELLGDSRFHNGLRGNLDRLARRRVAAHPRLALLNDQLHHSGQHELARSL